MIAEHFITKRRDIMGKTEDLITTEKLTEGMVVKNYKVLCELLGLEPAQGDSKKAQLKVIDRYIGYEKSGQKFLITEIYDEPMPKEVRMAVNSKYVQLIQPLLLGYLAKQEEEVIYISRTQLWYILGMVNHKYQMYKKNKHFLLNLDEQMSFFDIKNFYMRSASRINSILNPSLKSLQRRALIEYSDVYRVGLERYNEDGEVYLEFHDASEEETRYILEVKRRVLLDMECYDEVEVIFRGLQDKFYEAVNEIVLKEQEWSSIYKCLKIIFNKQHVEEAVAIDIKHSLNNLVIDALDRQAASNYSGAYNKDKKPSQIFYYPSTYVDMQKILTNHLIKI